MSKFWELLAEVKCGTVYVQRAGLHKLYPMTCVPNQQAFKLCESGAVREKEERGRGGVLWSLWLER